jgi:PST family polysaccharide transporter
MLITKLKQLTSGQYIQNVGWLGGAELANRVFRLGTTVTLARMFSPEDYGLMSIIYTTFEFANAFTLRAGIGAKIIQADEKDVKTIANTSYWLNWILCALIFIGQCVAAFPIAQFYGNEQLILPLCTSALTYLMVPLYMVNSAMIERENRLRIIAICNALGSLVTNIVTIALAFSGLGVWAIVWAMLLANPVWILVTWMNHEWRPPKKIDLKSWRDVVGFGGSLLGIDILNKVRGNIDYLIVGRFLGVEALGMYYFAYNAGFGITWNIMIAFNSATFPYLCEARANLSELKQRFFSSVKKTSAIVMPIIILQACLAPFYVPIIFGEKWLPAVPSLILICLSALAYPFGFAVYHLLNTVGKTRINLYWSFSNVIIFTILVLATVNLGMAWVAASSIIVQIPTLLFGLWAFRHVFREK